MRHHAALPYPEVGAFMGELKRQEGVAALALRFLILTAARNGEVLGARWDEIDLAARIWTVPAERMKGHREHRVPLSDPAFEVLRQVREISGGDLVFPGGRAGRPLSNMAMLTLLRRMKRSDLTAHGFRSTFRDVMPAFHGEANREKDPAWRRLLKALRGIDRDLTSQGAWLVNYAERHRAGLPVGASLTEATANSDSFSKPIPAPKWL